MELSFGGGVDTIFFVYFRRTFLQYWPECFLAAALMFFAFRELGTFPQLWADEGLFVIVARSIADGLGYVLPTYTFLWPYPNILTSGAPLIVPVALSLKLFGVSVAAARIPMTLYLLGTSGVFYVFTRRVSDLWTARFATALLISFSAYINTGKTVMGEIPGFFFFVLGCMAFFADRSRRNDILAGCFFGMAIVTKLTFGLLLPALGLPFLVALLKRRFKDVLSLLTIGGIAGFLLFVWLAFMSLHGNIVKELNQSAFSDGGTQLFYPLIHYAGDFLHFPFLYFYGLLVLALIGMYRLRHDTKTSALLFLAAFFLLNIAHILTVPYPPWYRYFLPIHLAFLPFVPIGMQSIVGRRIAAPILLGLIVLQGYWQWDHRGSSRGSAPQEAVNVLVQKYAKTPLVIIPSQIYALSPRSTPWLFISTEVERRTYTYEPFPNLPILQEKHCLPVVREVLADSIRKLDQKRVVPLTDQYVIVLPEAPCASVTLP